MPEENRTVRATELAMDILELLQKQDGTGVTELARTLDHAPSTVHAQLTTLRTKDFVTKQGDQYYPSLKILRMGEWLRTRKPAYKKAGNLTKKLAAETNGRVHFVVEESGQAVYLYSETSEDAVETYADVGKRSPLHVTAAGKAILANLPQSRIDEIIDRWGLPADTPNSITDPGTLRTELRAIREDQVAFNDEEHLKGIRAVGAPVITEADTVIGAFSISAPAQRMQGEWYEEELPYLLLSTVNELELELEYS